MKPTGRKAVPVGNYNMNEAIQEGDKIVGGVTITKVIKEHQSLVQREGESRSIGELIDAQLAAAAANSDIVQEVTLNLDPENWEQNLGPIYRDHYQHLVR